MTKPRISIFLVLLAFAFGLVRGPHPCRAEAPPSAPAVAEALEGMGRSGCHGHAAPAKAAAASETADGSDDADDAARKERLCEKACQRTAILTVQLPLIPESPVSFTSPVVEVRLQTLLAEPIDHVPLA